MELNMPRTTEGLCCSNVCDNTIPTGIGSVSFMITEEAGLNPRPVYCSKECAEHIRRAFYTVGRVDHESAWQKAYRERHQIM
jgi:hypothetical protein